MFIIETTTDFNKLIFKSSDKVKELIKKLRDLQKVSFFINSEGELFEFIEGLWVVLGLNSYIKTKVESPIQFESEVKNKDWNSYSNSELASYYLESILDSIEDVIEDEHLYLYDLTVEFLLDDCLKVDYLDTNKAFNFPLFVPTTEDCFIKSLSKVFSFDLRLPELLKYTEKFICKL